MKVTFKGVSYDAPALLVALHTRTQPLGLGVLQDRGPITFAQAEEILAAHKGLPDDHPFQFDYLYGRPIKVRADVNGELTEHSRELYDRDAGPGQFDKALAEAEIRE